MEVIVNFTGEKRKPAEILSEVQKTVKIMIFRIYSWSFLILF